MRWNIHKKGDNMAFYESMFGGGDYVSSIPKRIGTLDGVPVYKMIKTANTNIDNLGITLDDILELHVMVRRTGSGQWRAIPWLFATNDAYGGAEWAAGITVTKNGALQWQPGTAIFNMDRCVITIVYTKR